MDWTPFYVISGLVGYSLVGGLAYVYLTGIYENDDYPKAMYHDYSETAGLVGILWPVLFLPYCIAAKTHLTRACKRKEKEHRDTLLRQEGLL